MIQPIMKDPLFLARKSAPAGPEDLATAADLLETLEAHQEGCVGMAANMIGVLKNIIAFTESLKPSGISLDIPKAWDSTSLEKEEAMSELLLISEMR